MPAGRTGFANNQTYFDELAVQDALGAYPLMNFTGATLVRVLLDVVGYHENVVANPAVTQVGTFTQNLGVFVDETTAPTSNEWDPNAPSGDFMMRSQKSGRWRRESTTDGAGTTVWYDNVTTHLDIRVQRRIVENSRLWLAFHSFIAGSTSDIPHGWTGRILLKLP